MIGLGQYKFVMKSNFLNTIIMRLITHVWNYTRNF